MNASLRGRRKRKRIKIATAAETRRIVELWERGRATVLVTLVRVEGSSYRRTGARLLIAADGECAGAISGGCLEAEVIRKAQWKVRDGAVVDRYSTLFDDTAEIPYGLGCGGTVDLLLEPVDTPECLALLTALKASLEGLPGTHEGEDEEYAAEGETRRILTELPEFRRPLRRVVWNDAGKVLFESGAEAGAEAEDGQFEEWIEPPQRLIVFGAGDDAQPLVAIAGLLGWTVLVVDGRAQWARAERFPAAQAVWAKADAAGLRHSVQVRPRDAVVLMTHSYEQDREWLTAVLPSAPKYLGLLGSRHRSALLVSEAAARLDWSMDRACAGMFAPVGLDLGGDGAEAIALAVVAEVQACVEGKLGHSRRMTPEMVEAQLAEGGASRYLQAQCAL